MFDRLRTGLLLLLAAMGSQCFSPAEVLASEKLKGEVEKNSWRLQRPEVPTTGSAQTKGLNKFDFRIDERNVPATTNLIDKDAKQTAVKEVKSIFPLSDSRSILKGREASSAPQEVEKKGSVSDDQNSSVHANNTGGNASPPTDYNSGASKYKNKKVVLRLKRYRSQGETEVVWEAARMATRLLKKGAEVTIMLDMEGVTAANKNQNGLAWFEPNRGSGNTSAPKLTSPQDLLQEFVQTGGRLIVSERWAKLYGMVGSYGSPVISGTQVMSEDEMDDVMMEPNTSVISY